MFVYLLLAFTFVPAVEIALFVRIGSVIGPLATFAVVLATGIAGAALARSQGVRVVGEIRDSLEAGRLPADELAAGALVLIGGTLLLTPGFLTDFLGLLCLAPLSRHLLIALIKRWFQQRLSEMQTQGEAANWQVRVGGVRPGPGAQPRPGSQAQTWARPAASDDIRQTGPRTIDASYSVIEPASDEDESSEPSPEGSSDIGR
ncbi:MAG: FxsA protein [Rickettsiales bacterium]|nr:FxsA protein [Rickettsiales bacterium]